MSVQHVKGDLLDFTSWEVAFQSCNAQGVMGSGLAKAVREQYPEAFRVYREAYERNELQMGTSTIAKIGDKRRIVNAITQYRYGSDGRYVDYEALYKTLEGVKLSLESAAAEGRVYRLGLPYKLSSDRAGGRWEIVSAMIHVLFDESPIEVYIVEKEDAK